MSSFDFFPKVEDSLSERTLGGALVSVLSFAFVIWAGAHELSNCMRVETIDRLVPHTSAEHLNMISINLDLHFPALPCSELALEVRLALGKLAQPLHRLLLLPQPRLVRLRVILRLRELAL